MLFFYRRQYFILTVNYLPINRCDVFCVGRRGFFLQSFYLFIIIENDVHTRVFNYNFRYTIQTSRYIFIFKTRKCLKTFQ